MIEVNIKSHDKANSQSPARLKAILHAAGIPVIVDDTPTLSITEFGTFIVEAGHEGTRYLWKAAEGVPA